LYWTDLGIFLTLRSIIYDFYIASSGPAVAPAFTRALSFRKFVSSASQVIPARNYYSIEIVCLTLLQPALRAFVRFARLHRSAADVQVRTWVVLASCL
jgi:hypothetical protein